MNSGEDLDVFKLAHQLALKIYSVTKSFPREEMYSLVDQMRRAAISVGMNLMEGAMRLGTKEYRQFVGIARGSAGEVCYQLLVARDLNYISPRITNCALTMTGWFRCSLGCRSLWEANHEHDHVSFSTRSRGIAPASPVPAGRMNRSHGVSEDSR